MLIYESYNTVNGKSYYGLTTHSLHVRKSSHLRSAKSGSNSYFHKALRKYGPEVFEWSVILESTSLDSLYKLEKLVISLFEDWQTYNISKGGEHSAYGMKHTDETKKICSESAKRRWDNRRAKDKYPDWLFKLSSYSKASKFGVPKTTWYRYREV